MKKVILAALLLGGGMLPTAAQAQQATITQTIAGTRLDVNATGEVTRVPDLAIISAGVVPTEPPAGPAIEQPAHRESATPRARTGARAQRRTSQSSRMTSTRKNRT